MKASSELGRPGPGRCAVELVAGPHDGGRWHHPVEPSTMEPPVEIAREDKAQAYTYVRRAAPSRCEVDGTASWHYDMRRPGADA